MRRELILLCQAMSIYIQKMELGWQRSVKGKFLENWQLMSRSRSVTAKARSKCSATFIPKDVLLEKFENSDTAIQGIFRAVAVRLKKSNQELETLYEKCDKLQSDNAKLHGEVAKLKRSL